jgi:hypothetical protein
LGIIPGEPKKMYTHFKRHVDTLVNVAQAVVHRNQKCLDADGLVIAEVKRDLYSSFVIGIYIFFNATTCPLWTPWSPLPVVAEV